MADVGNNSNGRRDLALHYVLEPEPTAGFTGHLKSFFVCYPEQKDWPAPKTDFNYDCEGAERMGSKVSAPDPMVLQCVERDRKS